MAMLLLLVPFFYIARQMPGGVQMELPFSFAVLDDFAKNPHALFVILGIFVAVAIAQEFFKRRLTILTTTVLSGFNRDLSDHMYRAFAFARWSAILARRRSDIANALTNELKTIGMGTQIILQLATTAPMLAGQLLVCAFVSPEGTLAAIIVGALFFLFLRPVNKKLGNFTESLNELLKDSLSDAEEHLNGIKEVKSYGAESIHIERFEGKTRATMERFVGFVKLFTRSSFIYNSGTFVLVAAFIFMSLTVFDEGLVRLLILVIVFLRIWPIFSGLQMSLQMLMVMFPAWESFSKCMGELEDAREEYSAESGARPLALRRGLEISGLSFAYDPLQPRVLSDISFSVPANSSVAITGHSGSGKSTLVDIILGLLAPAEGQILIDGVPLQPETVLKWRMAIGYVPQETFLFRGTIRENLLWARPDADESGIWRALDLAAASDFIREMPDGLDTHLGDRGTRLSVGQRQRIALARALLREPALLVLDEATSSIDAENEKKIHDAMRGLHGKTTMLTIAHRITTIKEADEIIVLDRGRLIEKGSFSELIKKSGGRFAGLAGA
jgi:ATP-binding cassette subfamily C protein